MIKTKQPITTNGGKKRFKVKTYTSKSTDNDFRKLMHERTLADREVEDLEAKFKALVLLRSSPRINKSEILNVIRPYKISFKHPKVKEMIKEHNLLFYEIAKHQFYIDKAILLKIKNSDIDACTLDILYSGRTIKRISEFMSILQNVYNVDMKRITCEMMFSILKRNKIERDINGWRTKTYSSNQVKSHFKDTLNELGVNDGKEFGKAFFDLTGSNP